MTAPEQTEEDTYNFTQDESELFASLIEIGRLSDTIEVFGHEILISTLTVEEDLEIGLLLKKYADTMAFNRAWRTLLVAASVRQIDGRSLVSPLSLDDTPGAHSVEAKFEKMKNYFPVVIDGIFAGVQELEKKLVPVLSRLGKTSA